jgi:hypothetical protein
MYVMKWLLLVLCGSSLLLGAGDLSGVKSIYVMPMARGLDQYVASRLTSEHLFKVVTDPKLADAVLTDRIGDAFQIQLESMNPEPPPAAEKAAKKEDKREEAPKTRLVTDTVNKLDNPALNSSFGRGKGTIFLVDKKTRQVMWSTYDPAKGTDGKELDRTASDIVSRLKKDLNPPKK